MAKVFVPAPDTLVFTFTPFPLRWKLWMLDLSLTTSVYLPAFVGFFMLIVKPGPTVPVIFEKGAAFYKGYGMGRSMGTLPFQLAGNLRHGGLVEKAFGLTLRELLFDQEYAQFFRGAGDERIREGPDAFVGILGPFDGERGRGQEPLDGGEQEGLAEEMIAEEIGRAHV